jgi:hypothetical protein
MSRHYGNSTKLVTVAPIDRRSPMRRIGIQKNDFPPLWSMHLANSLHCDRSKDLIFSYAFHDFSDKGWSKYFDFLNVV